MFDDFAIVSGGVRFSHEQNEMEDWISESQKFQSGTGVFMVLSNETKRTEKHVFGSFTSGDDYGFTKTVLPVRLTQYREDKLVSRSQAKRLLAGVEKFSAVIFNFDPVESIGQAFADEIFRVFKTRQPDIERVDLNANKQVTQMIRRVLSTQ